MTAPSELQSSWPDLRTLDPDWYLTALFAPKHVRGDLMALYTFNNELARIPGLVSEPALGEIRLQWWRDALAARAMDASSGVPLAEALKAVIVTCDLPRGTLLGMIDARSADLAGGGFPDLQALKAYLYKTEGAVFALGAHILGVADAKASRAANSAGLAVGLTNLLCQLARDAAAGKIMLPLLMLEKHDIHVERLLAGTCAKEIKPVLAELAVEAREARDAAYRLITGIDPEARPVFAPLALVESYLNALERPGHTPMTHIADLNPLRRFWRLWRASRL